MTEQWECGSCGAITDPTVAMEGEPFHYADEDCRAVRDFAEDADFAPEATE